MRRIDRSFPNVYASEDDRQLAVKRDDNWLKPSIDQIITLQNKLRVTVAQNCDDIIIARQENIVLSENVRASAGMYKQLSDKLLRIEDRIIFEKNSLDSMMKSSKQTETRVADQQRQLMNRGIQVERNLARLEEDVMRLKQIGQMNNKKFQAMNDKMNEIMQQLTNSKNTMDVAIQDLREMNHNTELSINKNARSMMHELEQRIDADEQDRRNEHNTTMQKIDSLSTILNELKKHENREMQAYAKLVEEKDHEYRNELKNLFKKIKAHIDEKENTYDSKDKNMIENLDAKIHALQKELASERQERVNGLNKLEDETTEHLERVSKHILKELDNLGDSLQNTHTKEHVETVVQKMRKEIEANKHAIDRVLRAEITARKSQALKLNSSIQGMQKHTSETNIVVQEAIQEIKTYIDKELEIKSDSPVENASKFLPTIEKRLSDLEEKITKHEASVKKSQSPTDADFSIPILEQRVSNLEERLMQHENSKNNDEGYENAMKQMLNLDKKLNEIAKNLTSQLDNLQEENKDHNNMFRQVSELDEKLHDVEMKFTFQVNNLQDKADDNENKLKQMAYLDEKLCGVEETLTARVNKLQTSNMSFQEEFKRFPALETRFLSMERKLTKQKDELKDTAAVVKTTSKKLPNIDDKISSLEQRLRNEIDSLETSRMSFEEEFKKIPSLETKVLEVERKIKGHIDEFENAIPSSESKTNHHPLPNKKLLILEERLKSEIKKFKKTDSYLQHISLKDLPALNERLLVVEERLSNQTNQNKDSELLIEYKEDVSSELEERVSNLEKKLTHQKNNFERTNASLNSALKALPALDRRFLDLEERLTIQIRKLKRRDLSEVASSKPFSEIQRKVCELEKQLLEVKKNLLKSRKKELVEVPKVDLAKPLSDLERKVSDLAERLARQDSNKFINNQIKLHRTDESIHSSPLNDYEPDVIVRLAELEKNFKWQVEAFERERSKKLERQDTPNHVQRRTSSSSSSSRNRLSLLENTMEKLSSDLDRIELKTTKFKRSTMRTLQRQKRFRNKFIEFVNSRLLAGERVKIFIKSFGVQHMRYFTNVDNKNKQNLNVWGIYQALKMYTYKKKWLALIRKEPLSIDLKEYKRILKEEKLNEKNQSKVAEKKKNLPYYNIEDLSDSSEESEVEPEIKPNENDESTIAGENGEKQEPVPDEEGPKRINYEDHNSEDDYIKYKTDESDDESNKTEEFFPVTSSEEDFELFSDEDDDDDDDEEEQDTEDEKAGNNEEENDKDDGINDRKGANDDDKDTEMEDNEGVNENEDQDRHDDIEATEEDTDDDQQSDAQEIEKSSEDTGMSDNETNSNTESKNENKDRNIKS